MGICQYSFRSFRDKTIICMGIFIMDLGTIGFGRLSQCAVAYICDDDSGNSQK